MQIQIKANIVLCLIEGRIMSMLCFQLVPLLPGVSGTTFTT